MRGHWTTLVILGAWLACLLAWTSCDYAVPGESLPRTPETEHLHAAVDALAHAWEQTPGLPSIDTPRCTVALAEIDLRTVRPSVIRERRRPWRPACAAHGRTQYGSVGDRGGRVLKYRDAACQRQRIGDSHKGNDRNGHTASCRAWTVRRNTENLCASGL